ncbi:MAG: NUDIX hydrolase [Hyphomicrobium sp.]|jgi:8-oxo-dGTP pyrophosphatase MutT (NUDIX family)
MAAGSADMSRPAKLPKIRPRDAATLVIVDRAAGIPRILMGRRRPDQAFLPNKYVFPGGRVERADRGLDCADTLREHDRERLLLEVNGKPSPSLPAALALAAIRETFEETGIVIGRPSATALAIKAARRQNAWSTFLATGFAPSLSGLRFFARAITPPGRPRRYDTRFFFVDASAIAHRTAITDGELSNLDWFSIEEMQSLDLPSITRAVILDLAEHFELGLNADAQNAHANTQAYDIALNAPVPFYFHKNGRFERLLLR